MFTRENLAALMAAGPAPAVSILMPTNAGAQTAQEGPRLDNLVTQAVNRLVGRFQLRRTEAVELMAEAAALARTPDFWKGQAGGLAVYVRPGFLRSHHLALELNEEVVVGHLFHVTPLLPLLSAEGAFFVLSISSRRARLYQASRREMTLCRDVEMPAGMEAVRAESEHQENLHRRPAAPAGRSTAEMGGQGFGEDADQLKKEQRVEYLRRVANAVQSALANEQVPVVLAAQPEVEGHFRKLSGLKGLVGQSIQCNPDVIGEADMHQQACRIMQPVLELTREQAIDRFNSLFGVADARAVTKPAEIVRAAHDGRIDTLFLAEGSHLWGHFDAAAGKLVAHGTPGRDDDDLMDYAAGETIAKGGAVEVLPRDTVPHRELMAAVLRY